MRRIKGCYIPGDRLQHFSSRAKPEEVYEVLENQTFKPLWVRTKSFGKSPAYLVYGRTLAGRYLLVPGIVFEDPPMKGMFMPITVRAMTSKEKKFYEMHRKDDLGG